MKRQKATAHLNKPENMEKIYQILYPTHDQRNEKKIIKKYIKLIQNSKDKRHAKGAYNMKKTKR